MPSIKIPRSIEAKIHEIVYACSVETGVTLFGRKDGDTFEVVEVCGPGKHATHQELHYAGDNDHASDFYTELLKTQPDLKHIGEFHVHPCGMSRLSGGDRRTVKEVLATYEEFIAGVMLRTKGGVEIYPVYFARGKEGVDMRVIRDVRDLHIAVIGLGSGGSALADMLVRYGVGKLTLVDPDTFEPENIKRHILDNGYIPPISKLFPRLKFNKARVVMWRLRDINPNVSVLFIGAKFSSLPERPDLIACCADSDACCQLVNQYALEHHIPVVFGGVHGAAEMAEIITLIPGETPCYACYERDGSEPEPTQEKYTNPGYDSTRTPSQPGLWADILMAASIQFRAILDALQGKINPLVLARLRLPYSAEVIRQKKGCAVCSDNMEGLSI